MIITIQKPYPELLARLGGVEAVFLVGCSECATLCKTGGEDELRELASKLGEDGKRVTGTVVLEPACNLQNDRRMLRERKAELDRAGVVICLACGSGAQTVAEAVGLDVIPYLDTVFLGETERVGHFSQRCVLCGDCILDATAGHCPVARCPKNMMNGPCGGAKEGKCEVSPDVECVWTLIHNSLKGAGRLDLMDRMTAPRDWSRGEGGRPRRVVVGRDGE